MSLFNLSLSRSKQVKKKKKVEMSRWKVIIILYLSHEICGRDVLVLLKLELTYGSLEVDPTQQ